MPATQFGGIHLGYASLAFDSPFRNLKDYEDYLSRLRQIPRVLEQAMGHMRDGLRDHRMPPKYLLEKVSGQAQQIADDSLDKSPFTEPLRKFPDSISEAERKRLREEIESAVKNAVAPAYAKFAKFVREDYAPHGRLDPGVWALPDGEARYRFAVRHQTTTDFTADQIHQLGLKSVAEIETQMLAIAKAQGFSDLKSFNEHIRQDPKLHAKSGQQLLDLYTHYRDQMYGKLPELFGRLPKNKLEVVPMESFRSADSVPADYSLGAGDGSRPGTDQRQRVRAGKAAAAQRGSDRVPRRRPRTSPAIFDRAGTHRPAAVPQVQPRSECVYRRLGVLLRASGKRSGLLSGPVQRLRPPAE